MSLALRGSRSHIYHLLFQLRLHILLLRDHAGPVDLVHNCRVTVPPAPVISRLTHLPLFYGLKLILVLCQILARPS